MSQTTISIQVPDELLTQVGEVAQRAHTDSNTLILSAIEDYLAACEDDRLAVEDGDRAIEAGDVVSHEEMLRWLDEKRLRAAEAA